MCNCQNKVTSEITCTNCNRVISITHNQGKDPIKIAKLQNKKCSKCGENEFV